MRKDERGWPGGPGLPGIWPSRASPDLSREHRDNDSPLATTHQHRPAARVARHTLDTATQRHPSPGNVVKGRR